ncbi:hypothetical protein ACFYO1_27190 [Nocardia sp. NPDC006044]|uniref:hypothetical protein n=1 Tax=Nocardia sp. NPDC006044 TaxID=3364306 RepID=UPI003679EEF0
MAVEHASESGNTGSIRTCRKGAREMALLAAVVLGVSVFGYGGDAVPRAMAVMGPDDPNMDDMSPFTCVVSDSSTDVGRDDEDGIFTAVSTYITAAPNQDKRCDGAGIFGDVEQKAVQFKKAGNNCVISAAKVKGAERNNFDGQDNLSASKASITVPLAGGVSTIAFDGKGSNGKHVHRVHYEGKATGLKLSSCSAAGVPVKSVVKIKSTAKITPTS